MKFYPGRQNIVISAGEGHLSVCTVGIDKDKYNDSGDMQYLLKRKQGLFTRKIPRPKAVTCIAFSIGSSDHEILTGDTDGNVMVWKGIKVVRVLKGAHNGPVGDICVFEDGSFISGGEKDGSLVVFNMEYDLIGAGVTIPSNCGSLRCILPQSLQVSEEDSSRFYHIIVGTTYNSIIEITISLSQDSTDVYDFETEVLVQGHYGAVNGITEGNEGDQFISCGEASVILWDAAAHKPKWAHLLHGEIVNCVTIDGKCFLNMA